MAPQLPLPPDVGGQLTQSTRLIQALEGLQAASAETMTAANSQVAKLSEANGRNI